MKIGKLEIIVQWNGKISERFIRKKLMELKGRYASEGKASYPWKIDAIKWYRDETYRRTGELSSITFTKGLIEDVNYKYRVFYDEWYEVMRGK